MRKKIFASICALGCLAAVSQTVSGAAAKNAPNLTVSSIKADKGKIKAHNRVTVVYSIKNEGNSLAPSSIAKVDFGKGGTSDQGTVQVPALKPGQIFTNKVDYKVVDGKKYIIKVTADYKNTINESNELDNENKMSFSLGRAF